MFFVINNLLAPILKRQSFIFNLREVKLSECLQLVKTVSAYQHERHKIRRVVLSIELLQIIQDTVRLQCLHVSSREPVEHGARDYDVRLCDLSLASRLVAYIFLVFVVYSIQFSVRARLVKQRVLEELRENVKSFRERRIFNVEVVICVVFSCCCIFLTSMLSNKLVIIIFNWVLLGAKEKHVLTEVSQAIDNSSIWSFWIAQTASSNIHAS